MQDKPNVLGGRTAARPAPARCTIIIGLRHGLRVVGTREDQADLRSTNPSSCAQYQPLRKMARSHSFEALDPLTGRQGRKEWSCFMWTEFITNRPFTSGIDFSNIARVEVLKGPQGPAAPPILD